MSTTRRSKKWKFPIDFMGFHWVFGWNLEFHLAAWPLPGSLLSINMFQGKASEVIQWYWLVHSDFKRSPLAPQGGVHQVLLETKALWGRGVGLWMCCFTIQNHSALIYCLPCLDTRCRPRTSVKMGGKQKRRSFCLVIAGGMVSGSLSSHVLFNLVGFLYPNSVEFQFPRVIQDFWGPEWYSIQSGSCRLECCDPIQCKEAAKAFSRVYRCDVASFSHHWMSCKDSVAGLPNAVRFHLVLDCR